MSEIIRTDRGKPYQSITKKALHGSANLSQCGRFTHFSGALKSSGAFCAKQTIKFRACIT